MEVSDSEAVFGLPHLCTYVNFYILLYVCNFSLTITINFLQTHMEPNQYLCIKGHFMNNKLRKIKLNIARFNPIYFRCCASVK